MLQTAIASSSTSDQKPPDTAHLASLIRCARHSLNLADMQFRKGCDREGYSYLNTAHDFLQSAREMVWKSRRIERARHKGGVA